MFGFFTDKAPQFTAEQQARLDAVDASLAEARTNHVKTMNDLVKRRIADDIQFNADMQEIELKRQKINQRQNDLDAWITSLENK